ncbi:Oxysterol-binding protein, partial [Neocallimastix californiae]
IIRNIYLQLNSGVSIHDVSLPIFICEPRSMLEKISDFMCYPQFIIRVPYLENSLQRFVGIVRFVLSCWSLNPHVVKKPFNPVLGEYFRARWKFSDNSYGYYVGEQTSFNPPISSYYFCNPENGIVIHGEVRPKTKFFGTNLKTFLNGGNKIIFHKH